MNSIFLSYSAELWMTRCYCARRRPTCRSLIMRSCLKPGILLWLWFHDMLIVIPVSSCYKLVCLNDLPTVSGEKNHLFLSPTAHHNLYQKSLMDRRTLLLPPTLLDVSRWLQVCCLKLYREGVPWRFDGPWDFLYGWACGSYQGPWPWSPMMTCFIVVSVPWWAEGPIEVFHDGSV